MVKIIKIKFILSSRCLFVKSLQKADAYIWQFITYLNYKNICIFFIVRNYLSSCLINFHLFGKATNLKCFAVFIKFIDYR